jgi:hypothetical protein
MLYQMEQIRQGLRRMILITLQIDNTRPLMQHPFLVPFLYGIGDFPHEGMPFSQENVITDTDNFRKKRNHISCFANRFSVRDLGFFFVQVLNGQPEKIGRGRKKNRVLVD